MSAAADHGRAWVGRGGRGRIALLLAGLAAGPAAWSLQLVVGYAIASHACYPHDAPFRRSPPPGWGDEGAVLLALNLACLALAVAGFFAAASQSPRVDREQAKADAVIGRTRFLARCGMLACAGFGGAILVGTLTIAMTPACWSIPS
jgi:uncharacterized membrane protein